MPATTVTIKQKKPVTLSVLSGTTLLDAVRTAGISLDSPCSGNGTCGKCRIRILEGETQTGKLDALKPEDAAKGLTLACQNIVTGPVTIETTATSIIAVVTNRTGAVDFECVAVDTGGRVSETPAMASV